MVTLLGLAYENYIKGWHWVDSAPPMENTFQTVFSQFLYTNLEIYLGGSHAKQEAYNFENIN